MRISRKKSTKNRTEVFIYDKDGLLIGYYIYFKGRVLIFKNLFYPSPLSPFTQCPLKKVSCFNGTL